MLLMYFIQEHRDYDIMKSSNPELKKVTIRIDLHKQTKQRRQTIQVRICYKK